MSDFSEKQIEELLTWMPELMAYLRKRSEANDEDAKALFDELDSYCWHQPICEPGVICAGGKLRAKVALDEQEKIRRRHAHPERYRYGPGAPCADETERDEHEWTAP